MPKVTEGHLNMRQYRSMTAERMKAATASIQMEFKKALYKAVKNEKGHKFTTMRCELNRHIKSGGAKHNTSGCSYYTKWAGFKGMPKDFEWLINLPPMKSIDSKVKCDEVQKILDNNMGEDFEPSLRQWSDNIKVGQAKIQSLANNANSKVGFAIKPQNRCCKCAETIPHGQGDYCIPCYREELTGVRIPRDREFSHRYLDEGSANHAD